MDRKYELKNGLIILLNMELDTFLAILVLEYILMILLR